MPNDTPDLWMLFRAGLFMLGLAWLSRGALRLPGSRIRKGGPEATPDRMPSLPKAS